jgi:hypothetical protein
MSDVSPRERELSVRVARQIATSWSEYWPFAASSTPIDRREGQLRACKLFALAAEIVHDWPEPEGWIDLRLNLAAVVLETFGDGYVLLSARWPRGLPASAMPEPFSMSDAIGAGAVDAWCREHGTELELGMLDAGLRTTPIATSGDGQFGALAERGLVADIDRLREREDPAWDDFSTVTLDAASRLRYWVGEYRRLSTELAARGSDTCELADAPSSDELARELAAFRSTYATRQAHGAEAEAQIALGYTAHLVRVVYLIVHADPQTPYADLHLLSSEQLERNLHAVGLDSWLARAAPAAEPPAT